MSDNIQLVQLSNYAAPDVKEYYGQKWVLNGRNNEFYQYVIDRSSGSPTNEAVLNVFEVLLYGKGIVKKGEKDLYEELNEIFPKEEQRKIISDYKKFNMFSAKLVKSEGGGVGRIKHFPIDKLGLEKADDDGVINNVYYSFDWSKTYKYKPQPIKIFKGRMSDNEMMLLYRPYQAGHFYFRIPDYFSCLQWAQTEEEISNFSINHILNGLSFGYVINFNNGGSMSEEMKDETERRIKDKLTGSENSGKFILSFNDGKEAEVTVVALNPNTEAHQQWDSMLTNARDQIIKAHGAFPSLFGITNASGFSNNADELNTQSKLIQDYQITPKQHSFLDAFKDVFELAKLETDLEFLPLRENYSTDDEEALEIPLGENETEVETPKVNKETAKAQASLRGSVGGVQGILGIQKSYSEGLTDFESAVTILIEIYGFVREVAEKLLGDPDAEVELSEHICLSDNNEATVELADHLISFGEDLDDKKWYLLSVNEVDYKTDDVIYESIKFASTGTARPNSKSKQDSDDIVIRYRYKGNKFPQREFCQKMVFADKLYRKEDILQMESPKTNPGFGKGAGGVSGYSIWLWKGGGKMSANFPNGTCRHKWQREIYLKRGGGVDVNSPLAKKITAMDARRKGYTVPTNRAAVGRTPNQNKV